MYTILHRTGVKGGRVYNFTGDNITEAPTGAGNLMVGPWVYDYSAFITTWADDEPMGSPIDTVLYDSEFSGIILDGRAMRQGTTEETELYQDLDEDEDSTDSRSVLKTGDRYASVHDVRIRLYHTGVRWEDARVWRLYPDGTFDTPPVAPGDEAAANNTGQPLDNWLNYLMNGTFLGEPGPWHQVRHYLRVPVMWAIYHCPFTPRYAGLTEMIGLNTPATVIGGDLLSYGPAGMLTAMHGEVYSKTHALRLPEAALTNVKPVDRGMFSMPYDAAGEETNDPDATSSTAPVAGELSMSGLSSEPAITGDLLTLATGGTSGDSVDQELGITLPGDGTATGILTPVTDMTGTLTGVPVPTTIELNSDYVPVSGSSTLAATLTGGQRLDTPAQRARGRIYTTVIGTARNMRSSPKRITVWHFQTCPVRLHATQDAGGNDVHYIVGGLTSPFEGPPIRLIYHEAVAKYSAR